MIRLSVIIVNYNVKFFLEQSLLSVRKAVKNIPSEIFVVDNHSVDGSVEMIRKKFHEVILTENKTNVGFAKANNQAILQAKGEYVLLLNPDTVVEEDTLEKCIRFMDEHPEAGGLGVKMLDGKGNFLPESKRGFPSPSVAFYKTFGLSKLFPHSKTFARYHLGHLSPDETNEVEVLAGAFMFIRKKVLDEIGLLDEKFFMYGEDIDLSYRIVTAGYKNYYFAETRIIHYKGESTKKGSLNYVRMFYNAMIIFARKHFSGQKAGWFILLLKLAIYFRAAISLLSHFVKVIAQPLFDAVILYAGMFLLKTFWESHAKGGEGVTYPLQFTAVIVPAYILIWLISVYFSGGYDKNTRPSKISRGLFIGTLLIAAGYGFLDESLRFSRAMILLGFMFALFSMIGWRMLLHLFRFGTLNLGDTQEKKLIIVGGHDEARRVLSLVKEARVKTNFLGFVLPVILSGAKESAQNIQDTNDEFLGTGDQLKGLAEIYKADEIIFCSKDISSQQIISWMTSIGSAVDYKIVPEESLSIIGSNSKDLPGELYTIDIRMAIVTDANQRNKRLLDVLLSLFFLVTFPVQLFIVKNSLGLLSNIFSVLFNRKSWVGYAQTNGKPDEKLPAIKYGVIHPDDAVRHSINESVVTRLNFLYAKDYSVWKDVEFVIKSYRKLGR